MKDRRVVDLLLASFVFAMCTLGCTAVVRPSVRESDFLSSSQKTNATVDLYITEEFRSHRVSKTDVMDLKSWEFDLGPVASDAFKYGLMADFTRVEIHSGAPKFPLPSTGATEVQVAVQPTFVSFDSHVPYLFKFETYTVDVGFEVDVYDKEGNKLSSKTYQGHGEQRGAIGAESAGHAATPVAAELAIRDAVQKAAADVQESVKSIFSAASRREDR